MLRALLAVAVVALACLLVRATGVGLAGDYVDPVSKITAQDEALYAHSSIRMATEGDWRPRVHGPVRALQAAAPHVGFRTLATALAILATG